MDKIDASPTKEFFISILGRDITLLDAVKDLVDNSVDGARKIRPDGNLQGLSVHIEMTADHFVIVDNCGGISVDVAKNYAFRFGRAARAPSAPGSIGQFGVGMKRALFKIGNAFEITSKAPDSHFILKVDVEKWKTLRDDNGRDLWEFEFSEAVENEQNPIDTCGTTLQITNLHPEISSEFTSSTFLNRLIAGLQEAHERSMDAGLEIEVGTYQLRHRMAELLASKCLKPIRIDKTFPASEDTGLMAPVRMTIYAGVAESSLSDAGWYIVCNGRQIVKADKSSLTGWATVLDEVTTPKAHNQFARFRGYVIFESLDAGSLPWNTSKSGVNTESRVYQWARREMVVALRQVIDFLNMLDAELDTDSTHLRDLLKHATAIRLGEITESSSFQYPKAPAATDVPKTVRISFDRLIEEVEFAKEFFSAPSAKKAGEETFEYFIERERV